MNKILSDDECRNIYGLAMKLPERNQVSVTRYVESATIAKLVARAGVMPKPVVSTLLCNTGKECKCPEESTQCEQPTVDLYTADQMREAIASMQANIEQLQRDKA